MAEKENRPDACTASGTANPINSNFSTGACFDQGNEEFCDVDGLVEYCRGQQIAYDDLMVESTLMYLSELSPDFMPDIGSLKHNLTVVTNRCIDVYNLGFENETVPADAKMSERYPDQKPTSERYKRLKGLHPLQIALVLRELHHAVGIRLDESNSDENFGIGVYQSEGFNEGTYDTSRLGLERLIHSYDMTISARNVDETVAVLRSI